MNFSFYSRQLLSMLFPQIPRHYLILPLLLLDFGNLSIQLKNHPRTFMFIFSNEHMSNYSI